MLSRLFQHVPLYEGTLLRGSYPHNCFKYSVAICICGLFTRQYILFFGVLSKGESENECMQKSFRIAENIAMGYCHVPLTFL